MAGAAIVDNDLEVALEQQGAAAVNFQNECGS